MTSSSTEPRWPARADDTLISGLEMIIDAATGILAAQSLSETLQGMADALAGIVPYTSLAVYEADWQQRILVPLLANGSYVQETLRSRPAIDDSITGSAALLGELVCHEPGDPLLGQYVMPGTPANSQEAIIVAPLLVSDRVVGTLNVWREDHDPWFAPEEAMLLRRFASLAAMAYSNSAQREQLRVQAITDELTGLYNRRHCQRTLASTMQHARGWKRPTSVAYFDIDAFKAINDTFGHAAGDNALRAFAAVLRAQVRDADTVCRTGGEEFTVILPGADQAQAIAIAERVVAAVRAAGLGPEANMTVSAGVATCPKSDGDIETLIRAADVNLLRAKRAGRDRVIAEVG